MLKRFIALLPVLATTAAFAQAPQGLPANFHFTKMANGLEVLVIEDAAVPLVTIEIVVRNGSYTEPPDYNGLSHLYEHMFFKANKTYPTQEAYLERVNELGIEFNGTTSEERVNYYFTMGSNKLQEGLQFMNDAIRYPLFLQDEMKRENVVVAGEFQRNESNPVFFLLDRTAREMWGELYSRKNVIGDYKMILSATPEKMNVVKNKYYWPNNSMLVIAGDAKHEDVFARVKAMYGDWQPSGFDPHVKFPVPEFKPLATTKQFLVRNENAQIPIVLLSWMGPDTRNDVPSTYAADVFNTILMQEGSKFRKALDESGLTYQTSIGYSTQKHVGPIQAFIVPNPAQIQPALDAFWAQVAMWENDDYFTDEELKAAKDQMGYNTLYERQATSQFVHTVTFWWASASLNYFANYLTNLQKVDRQAIKNYVRTYIKDKNYTAGMLVPPAMEGPLNIATVFPETVNPDTFAVQFTQLKSTTLTDADRANLDRIAATLRLNPKRKIEVAVGAGRKEAKNTSTLRGEAIRSYLASKGVDARRVVIKDAGRAKEKNTGEALNRQMRVSFRMI